MKMLARFSLSCDAGPTGNLALVARNADGKWVNAADLDLGGTKTFVSGPYSSSHGLGTYGVDAATNAVWAVLNYCGSFAAGNLDKLVDGYVWGM